MPGVYSGQGQEAPGGAGAERRGAGWNAFQDPSWCPLRAQVLPTGQRVGWCSLGTPCPQSAASFPFLRKALGAVRLAWGSASQLQAWGPRESGPEAAFPV